MNHNEEVPDFLGGLGDMLPADVLKKVNELLERVHRKDKDHQGSSVFIYAPGSQYVDKQINIGETHTPETLPVPPRPSLCREGEWAHTPSKDTIPRGAHPTVHRTIDDGAVWRRTTVLPARALAGGVSHTGG